MLKKIFAAAAIAGLTATPAMADDGLYTDYNTNQATITVDEIAELAWQQVDAAANNVDFRITNFDGGSDPASEIRTVHFMTNITAEVSVAMTQGDIPKGTTLSVMADDVTFGAPGATATWARDNNGDYTISGTDSPLFTCGDVVQATLGTAVMFENSGSADLKFTAHNTNGVAPAVATDTATLTYTITGTEGTPGS